MLKTLRVLWGVLLKVCVCVYTCRYLGYRVQLFNMVWALWGEVHKKAFGKTSETCKGRPKEFNDLILMSTTPKTTTPCLSHDPCSEDLLTADVYLVTWVIGLRIGGYSAYSR